MSCFLAESKSQVYGSIHSLLQLNPAQTSKLSKHSHLVCYGIYSHDLFSEFLVYDDGCHLRKFSTNPVRSTLTEPARKLASLEIVIDKMHFKGHTDAWCIRHCNPNNFSQLEKVIMH